MPKKRTTSDAIEILHARFYRGRPNRQSQLEAARVGAEIGRQLYVLREKARLSQRDLAQLVGISTSIIGRLEDADYDGYPLALLRRIAAALNQRVEVRFVSASRSRAQPDLTPEPGQRSGARTRT